MSAARVIDGLTAALRRRFACVFAALCGAPSRAAEIAALAELDALLRSVEHMLLAEREARCGLASLCPDASFGSADLLWATRRLQALLQHARADARPARDELLDYLALFHGELLIALHARRHEIAPWLGGEKGCAAAGALLANYRASLDALESAAPLPEPATA